MTLPRTLIAMSPLRLSAAFLALVAASAAAQPADRVRVHLFAGATLSEATVEAVGPLAVSADGRSVGTLAPGARLRLRAEGGVVRATAPGLDVEAREVALEDGPARVVAGRQSRTYAGALRASASGGRLALVNHVPVEDYVASVVASEYPFPEVEGVKAQAVLARTYALRRRGAHALYDVEDGVGSQVYRGLGVVTAVARRAAAETAGEVLTYDGTLAEAVYSSSSGGHTADNESAWAGAPLPYLRGVEDPWDADAPDARWRTTADVEAVHRALSARFGGRVTGVAVAERSREGRVLRLRLDGARQPAVTGPEFRRVVNAAVGARTVRSTRFEVQQRDGQYAFEGSGFGHGVGMSQYGARGQARAGRSYRDILAFYFGGTEVRPAPGAEGPARWAATPETPAPPAVRGSAEARRWPTPRRQARPTWTEPAAPETAPPPRRRAW